jgi:hypothetical protein
LPAAVTAARSAASRLARYASAPASSQKRPTVQGDSTSNDRYTPAQAASLFESPSSVRQCAGTPPTNVTRYRGSALVVSQSMSLAASAAVPARSENPRPHRYNTGLPPSLR